MAPNRALAAGGGLALAISGLFAAGTVYSTSLHQWGPTWEAVSSMEETHGDVREKTETLKLRNSQPSDWKVVARQQSRVGDILQRMETLHREPPPPVALKAAFAATAVGAVAILGALALLSLSVACAFLGSGAFALTLVGVLGLFALVALAFAHASHSLLGHFLGSWAALLTTPLSFWGSVNFLGVITRVVGGGAELWARLGMAYGWLLPSHEVDVIDKDAGEVAKVVPGLLRPFLSGPHDKPATTQEWAAQLDLVLSRHLGAAECSPSDAGRYAALAQEVRGPELPVLPPVTGVKSAVPAARAYFGGLGSAVGALQEASGEGDAKVEITAFELVAFVWYYITSLFSACLDHSRFRLWSQIQGSCLKREDAADKIQWRLVADQYVWSQQQKLSVTDVAARVLERRGEAGRAATARALRAWLAVDVALSWCHIIPALWVVPPKHCEALKQRREVVMHLSGPDSPRAPSASTPSPPATSFEAERAGFHVI